MTFFLLWKVPAKWWQEALRVDMTKAKGKLKRGVLWPEVLDWVWEFREGRVGFGSCAFEQCWIVCSESSLSHWRMNKAICILMNVYVLRARARVSVCVLSLTINAFHQPYHTKKYDQNSKETRSVQIINFNSWLTHNLSLDKSSTHNEPLIFVRWHLCFDDGIVNYRWR